MQTADCERSDARTSSTVRLGVMLLSRWPLVASGCAAGQAFRQGDDAMRAGNSTRPWRTTARRCRPIPDNAELQDRARARDAGRVARAFRPGAGVRGSRISSRRRSASTGWPPSTTRATARRRPRSPRSIRRSASASRRRGRGPPIEQLRERARAASAAADPEPGVARAADPALHQRQPARHPQLHRRTAPASTSPTTATCHGPARHACSSTASRSSRRSTRS